MKLLRVKASHFKNCQDDTVIDLVAKSKKTTEDKEYELQEIAEGLYVYSMGKTRNGARWLNSRRKMEMKWSRAFCSVPFSWRFQGSFAWEWIEFQKGEVAHDITLVSVI